MGIDTGTMALQPQGAMTPIIQPVRVEKPDAAESAARAAQQTERIANTVENIREKAQADGEEQIRKAVEQLNRKIGNSEAVFGIHEDTNRVTIKLIDRDTREVIKELPPEKTLDMIAKLWDMAGILVDERR